MNNTTWLTVKEVAEKTGTSQQAVYRKLNTSWKSLSRVVNGRKLVNSKVLNLSNSIGVEEVDNNFNTNSIGVESGETLATLKEEVEFLKAQLVAKDKQLEEANLRLKEAHEITKNNQMIYAQSMKSIAAENGSIEVEAVEHETTTSEPTAELNEVVAVEENKLHWWQKIFR